MSTFVRRKPVVTGELWEEGEFFLPELVGAAQAMKSAIDVLRSEIRGST